MSKRIENLAVTAIGRRLFASWVSDGARYHFWFTAAAVQPESGIVYKNPLSVTSRPGDDGYFHTRRLKADSASWAPTIAEVIARISGDMISAALSREDTELQARHRYVYSDVDLWVPERA